MRWSDERGQISVICDRPIGSILEILSLKGSKRSNHYHKTDWHLMYIVSGSMDYYDRPAGSSDIPRIRHLKTGGMVETPPMVEHTCVFLEDTVLLAFSGSKRDEESYANDMVKSADLSAV